ncbi:MAG: cation diffusion facilitator family transporter [Candidatus Omnitrophica bacterium]|nr:cation diffusion facilitator family transporter [Candidatus Omnitrophota bacterium]
MHYQQIRRILILVLVLNWSVALAKIVLGLLSKCVSMIADGFHSFADGTSNIIGIIGITLASQPKDTDHPYGHRKYETLFSLGIAISLFLVSFNIGKEAIVRIITPVLPQIDTRSFLVMLITLGVNFMVMRYEYKKGRLLGSDILIADSLHTRADILTSTAVILALVAIKLGYPILDPLVTLMIACLIAYSGYRIAKKSSDILCDTAAIIDVKKIVDIVLTIKGIKSCHKIRTRGRPDDIHIDLHVQVNPNMHMDEAHKISYEIEAAIKKNIPQITDVMVHMEPR